jgi:ribosomal protein S14
MIDRDFDIYEEGPVCDRCGQRIGIFSVTVYCKQCLRDMGELK